MREASAQTAPCQACCEGCAGLPWQPPPAVACGAAACAWLLLLLLLLLRRKLLAWRVGFCDCAVPPHAPIPGGHSACVQAAGGAEGLQDMQAPCVCMRASSSGTVSVCGLAIAAPPVLWPTMPTAPAPTRCLPLLQQGPELGRPCSEELAPMIKAQVPVRRSPSGGAPACSMAGRRHPQHATPDRAPCGSMRGYCARTGLTLAHVEQGHLITMFRQQAGAGEACDAAPHHGHLCWPLPIAFRCHGDVPPQYCDPLPAAMRVAAPTGAHWDHGRTSRNQ